MQNLAVPAKQIKTVVVVKTINFITKIIIQNKQQSRPYYINRFLYIIFSHSSYRAPILIHISIKSVTKEFKIRQEYGRTPVDQARFHKTQLQQRGVVHNSPRFIVARHKIYKILGRERPRGPNKKLPTLILNN